FLIPDNETRAVKAAEAFDRNFRHDRLEAGVEYVNNMPAHLVNGSQRKIICVLCVFAVQFILITRYVGHRN
ncbi:MAG: hypothetical protein N2F24_12015, partial [Deltaproteobacteria bacterium]